VAEDSATIQRAQRDRTTAFGYDRRPMEGTSVDWQAQDWEDLVPRLLLLAVSRLRRLRWRGDRAGVPPGGPEAEDFVNDAISKTMAGVRAWDAAACTLFQHLAGVIVSDISHAVGSVENRSTLRPQGQDDGSGPPTDIEDATPDQETTVHWRLEQRRLLVYLERTDPALSRMAELMLLHDLQETHELSRGLGVSPAEVANRRKRLKRAVRAFLMETVA
jgi:hypothetical protein